jgi:hypothetical protein
MPTVNAEPIAGEELSWCISRKCPGMLGEIIPSEKSDIFLYGAAFPGDG